MAERYKGRVLRVSLGGSDNAENEALLRRLLTDIDGLTGFTIDAAPRVLTAWIDAEAPAEDAILKALLASGMFPRMVNDTGTAQGGASNAC